MENGPVSINLVQMLSLRCCQHALKEIFDEECSDWSGDSGLTRSYLDPVCFFCCFTSTTGKKYRAEVTLPANHHLHREELITLILTDAASKKYEKSYRLGSDGELLEVT